jgi:hypothetical protein
MQDGAVSSKNLRILCMHNKDKLVKNHEKDKKTILEHKKTSSDRVLDRAW